MSAHKKSNAKKKRSQLAKLMDDLAIEHEIVDATLTIIRQEAKKIIQICDHGRPTCPVPGTSMSHEISRPLRDSFVFLRKFALMMDLEKLFSEKYHVIMEKYFEANVIRSHVRHVRMIGDKVLKWVKKVRSGK